MKIKDIPINTRPREKLLEYGSSNLSLEDLLAIILKTGTKGLSSKSLALNILSKYNTLNNLKQASFEDLIKIKGIGKVKAVELLAIIEFSKRIINENIDYKTIKFNNPQMIFEYLKEELSTLKQEHFYCLYLNNAKKLIKKKLLFIGTINKSIVHPREIFKESYNVSASSIICIHNHPSGNVKPSKEDLYITDKLVEIGNLLGIKIDDHIIIGNDKYYSFYENGHII